MKIKCCIFLILFSFCMAVYAGNDIKKTVLIAAAANFQEPLKEIAAEFSKSNDSIELKLSFGSSGNLYTQIKEGAPYEMFFSADTGFPAKLFNEEFGAEKPINYALGTLVLWTLNGSEIDINAGMELFKKFDAGKISIANPITAPYGEKAVECLKFYGLYEAVKDNFVVGKDISQAAQYISTGNAKIGFIPLSTALNKNFKDAGKYFVIDSKSYSPLVQAYIVLKKGADKKSLKTFIEFFESAATKKILKKYGYRLPENE